MKQIIILIVFMLILIVVKSQTVTDSLILKAKKIDMKVLVARPYFLKHFKTVNCDSLKGSRLEEQICAYYELQKKDSILNVLLNKILKDFDPDSAFISLNNFKLNQEIWERYRYSYCTLCKDENLRTQEIQFMQCATKLTIQRIEDLKNLCFLLY
jgi:uncharacterized protein YecT (DUF1311 family)